MCSYRVGLARRLYPKYTQHRERSSLKSQQYPDVPTLESPYNTTLVCETSPFLTNYPVLDVNPTIGLILAIAFLPVGLITVLTVSIPSAKGEGICSYPGHAPRAAPIRS